ncbi:MAG TPA: hypothetical protein VGJ97_04105 [Anaerolineaceae bacterium]
MALQAARAVLLLVLGHESRSVLGVAARTRRRIEGRGLAQMAAGTEDRLAVVAGGMARQGKGCEGMVENSALDDCRLPGIRGVAGGAVHAEHPGVFFRLGVTVRTGPRSGVVAVVAVAGSALRQRVLPEQREPGGGVIEARQSKRGRVEAAALVFGMAGGALAEIGQTAVYAGLGGHLGKDRLVAAHAQRRHLGLGRAVAFLAVCLEAGVGGKPLEGSSGQALGAQGAGVKPQTARPPDGNRQPGEEQQGKTNRQR